MAEAKLESSTLLTKARTGIELLRHSVVALVAGGTVIFAGLSVYQAATNDSIVIDPISVPSDFESHGFGGAIANQRILDEVAVIQTLSASRKGAVGISDKPISDSVPDLETPIGGVNFKSVANVIRQALGKKVIRITGEIIAKESKGGSPKVYELRLRRLPERKMLVSVESSGPPDDLFRKAAYALVESFDPYTAARAYYKKKDAKNALRMVSECLTNTDPDDDKWALVLRAWINWEQGKFDDVLADANAALSLDPNFPSGYYWRSFAYREKKNFDQALAAAEQTIRLAPNQWDGYFVKGRALRDLGRDEEAVRSLDQAIKLNPRHNPSFNQSGLALMKLKRWKEAADRFDKASHIEPENPWYRHNLADALNEQGKRDEALTEIRKAVALDPTNPAMHVMAGTIGLALDKRQDALQSAITVRKLIDEDRKTLPEWAKEDAAKLMDIIPAKKPARR